MARTLLSIVFIIFFLVFSVRPLLWAQGMKTLDSDTIGVSGKVKEIREKELILENVEIVKKGKTEFVSGNVFLDLPRDDFEKTGNKIRYKPLDIIISVGDTIDTSGKPTGDNKRFDAQVLLKR